MRKPIGVLVAIVLVIAAALALWWFSQGERELEPNPAGAGERPASKAPGVDPSAPTSDAASDASSEIARAKAQRAKRDELHRQIVSAQKADSAPNPREPAIHPSEGDEREPTSEGLRDRTGNHGYLMKVMNEDLMPLMDECIAMARERQPELSGMLIVDLELIGDEEIGGVVETAGPGTNNEVADPELLECVTESILSATLPPPPEGGRDPISISMPVSSDE